MNTLIINLLIVLFSLLILYNIIFRRSIVETMDSNDGYKDYSDDPNILAQQNAGNIKVLKDQAIVAKGNALVIESVYSSRIYRNGYDVEAASVSVSVYKCPFIEQDYNFDY